MSEREIIFIAGVFFGAVLVPLFWGGMLLGVSFLAEFVAAAREHRRTRLAKLRWDAQQRAEAKQFEAEIRADLSRTYSLDPKSPEFAQLIRKVTVRQ